MTPVVPESLSAAGAAGGGGSSMLLFGASRSPTQAIATYSLRTYANQQALAKPRRF